jgi:hypothetical protein
VCTADGCQSQYRLQPHHITPHQGRSNHRRQSDAALLVPPSCGRPHPRLPDRS